MLRRFAGWLARKTGASKELEQQYDLAVTTAAQLAARNAALQNYAVAYQSQQTTQQEALSSLLTAMVARAGGSVELSYDLVAAAGNLLTDAKPDEKRQVVILTSREAPPASDEDVEGSDDDCGDEVAEEEEAA